MRAGAGKAEIRIPDALFPLETFSAVHDPLHIRVLLLEAGASFALVSVEMTSLRDYAVEELRNLVAEQTGLDAGHIWICVTHTFSAPHTRSESALKRGGPELRAKNAGLSAAIHQALREALEQAMASCQPVRLGFGAGNCGVNVSRDVETTQGWWLGRNEQGYSDHSLPVIRLDRVDSGKPLAILFNYDVQSSVMDGSRISDGTSLVTGDLAGMASGYIENAYGQDTVALFLLGAAGDQAPLFQAKRSGLNPSGELETEDIGQQGFLLQQELGILLGSQVLQIAESLKTVETEVTLSVRQVSCTCPGQKIMEPRPDHPMKSYRFERQEDRISTAEIVMLGSVALVGVKPELSSYTAHVLRESAPCELVMLGTMVNGGEKYMPEASAYDRITYEAMNSAYGKGAAEQFMQSILRCLEEVCDD